MSFTIGIRREDKSKWERRVPITPKHVQELKEKHSIETIIQPSVIRVFQDDAYINAGARVQENVEECPIVFAVKEIPLQFFEPGKTYVFFSHTIKGQKYNMPMLRKMMDLNCNLIDYEKITNDKGFRLVFFGRYAGLAGMVDSLWSFGKRMEFNNILSPLNEIKKTVEYKNLDEVKIHLKKIGQKIKNEGLPKSISPFIIGFAGYGHVSNGAQEILDLFPIKEISPDDLVENFNQLSNKYVYKVIFKEKDLVEPKTADIIFELQDYYNHPEKYTSKFDRYLSYLSILMNCIYWDSRYPRLITKDYVNQNFNNMRLKVIGDISIDINGAIEITEKATTPDMPSFIYDPETESIKDGVEGNGIVIMGVDNLPCELPIESSNEFSNSLFNFILGIVKADYKKDFEFIDLPSEIKRAVILYHGELTPNYQYIGKYL